ncbi:hypothetical protein EB835_17540 [Brevibacterium sp. S22]|nr:hypothetical protein EB835_17540 [Brevibacterium sp. S22]
MTNHVTAARATTHQREWPTRADAREFSGRSSAFQTPRTRRIDQTIAYITAWGLEYEAFQALFLN